MGKSRRSSSRARFRRASGDAEESIAPAFQKTVSAKEQRLITISVIVGSTRQGRFSEKPAQWILSISRARGIEARLLDLRDFPMPFLTRPSRRTPGRARTRIRRQTLDRRDRRIGWVRFSSPRNNNTAFSQC